MEERKEGRTERQGKQTASIDYKAEGCETSTLKHVVFGAMAHNSLIQEAEERINSRPAWTT